MADCKSSSDEFYSTIGPVHWCPHGDDSFFGNRQTAQQLLGVPHLHQKGFTGKNVNVVVVDQGLNAARLGVNYAGGWAVNGIQPGATAPQSDKPHGGHGMMVAANVVQAAPEARLYDLPMIPAEPKRIDEIEKFFVETGVPAFTKMLDDINKRSGQWILVNAWAIFDRSSDPDGNYTSNPAHDFNKLMDRAVAAGHDVIFGAGNCGEFCPNPRCGPNDHGPGKSIFGANSHPKVLTVGACRSDRVWLGYSSQGPGTLDPNKPDLCAPSEFTEDTNLATVNRGTSAACALTAGIVACLRSRWNSKSVSPGELKDILNRTATNENGERNDMIGNGILNASAACDALNRRARPGPKG